VPLPHVYWIGGGSGAGKSTIARRIAAEHGLGVYSTDDAIDDHVRRSAPADTPYLTRFLATDMAGRWVDRSPREMLRTFPWFRGEGFELIAEDLARMPARPGTVAEGFRLLPHLVEPLLTDRRRAVWLLPTPAFRAAAFATRTTGWDLPGTTGDPERARRNLFERDHLFTEHLRAETARLGLAAVEVDVGLSEDDLTAAVARGLGL
jgi:hypothetical protein